MSRAGVQPAVDFPGHTPMMQQYLREGTFLDIT